MTLKVYLAVVAQVHSIIQNNPDIPDYVKENYVLQQDG